MGTIKAKDDLVDVRKFEPMRVGVNRLKLCQQAEKHFPVFTDDTRKTLAVDDLKRRRCVADAANTPGATTVMASSMQRRTSSNFKLSAVHAEILTLVNAEDPIEEVD